MLDEGEKMKKGGSLLPQSLIAISVLGLVLLIVSLLLVSRNLPHTAEVQIGYSVIIAVTAIMALLTVMAMIYKQANLSDRTQALGLPEGSIRALIALLLLLVFAMTSLYLFGEVTRVQEGQLLDLTEEQVNEIDPSDIYAQRKVDDDNYEVVVRVKSIGEEGEQFAQQIFTAMLTLVTAVSSFYFANRVDIGRQESTDNELKTSELNVTGITPASGEAQKGNIFISNLAGNGFTDGTKVKLQRDGEMDVAATDIEVLNKSRILCSLDLTDKTAGKWSVVVITPDNKESKFIDGFEIK